MTIKPDEKDPFFSILILAHGPQSYLISLTLESLTNQTYSDFELLIIDAREEKKELVFKELKNRNVTIEMPVGTEPVEEEMLPILLEQAKGRYIHILRAGEYYLATHCLHWAAEALAAEDFPDLLCTGFIHHHSLSPTEFLYILPTKKNLVQGRFPAQAACLWKRKNLLDLLENNKNRWDCFVYGDLLCRYVEAGKGFGFLKRILIDYIYQVPTPRKAVRNVAEVGQVLLHHFGLRLSFARWFMRIAGHLIRWWVARVKKMFYPIT
jgi:hypothetical protein